jgi:acetyl-CoA carboxylase carboxyl transferase subunit beta
MARSIDTHELIAALVDERSWRPWDAPVVDPPADPAYTAELRAARAAAESDEAVISGSGRINGAAVAIVAGDFRFLAGSIGRTAAARLIAAFERATSLGLPVLGLPNSGGTRMQEGTPAFLLMAGIAAAVRRHRSAGLAFLVYLRHPTTGGVLATWGSLGDMTHAQPEAMIGFLGPRVFEGLRGEPFPPGVQTAEGLAGAGVIDGCVDPSRWRELVSDALAAYRARRVPGPESVAWESAGSGGRRSVSESTSRIHPPAVRDGWGSVVATRDAGRPGLRELLQHVAGFVPLSGTQAGEVAAATLAGVGRIDGVGCVLVGFDRAAQFAGAAVGPADLRFARRAMALAERWGLPLVTVIDTQGGELSPAAESGALAGEIARCLAGLAELDTPVLSLLLGGGAGGAAIALLPGDRVLAVSDSWVTPLPPEGASLIRHRTTQRADDMANTQKITAADLAEVGAVDRIIGPPQGDLAAVALALGEELSQLASGPVDLGVRSGRWSGIGH